MICRAGAVVLPAFLRGPRSARVLTSPHFQKVWHPTHSWKRNLHSLSRRDRQSDWVRRNDVLPVSDTIYALSTAPGRAAIAVIRVSGPSCLDIYGGLCPNRALPHPRTATLRKLRHPESSEVLDRGALILYFPSPNTVTGEDILELHVHGGPAIVRSVLEAIPACSHARDRRRPAEYSRIRPAEAGEFTKRAFYNGRLDLTEAEALGDSLSAETEQQRRLAISGSESGLAQRYNEWRNMLLYARGELEALIDFSEDQHFDESPQEFVSSITTQVTALKRQIEIHIRNASRGELLRSGITIALLGAPNAGKSSLLNRIVGREAAIVSAEEGTTRDIVDVSVDIGGWLCRMGDMAGLRARSRDTRTIASPIGVVEEEGIRRARARALESDVVVVLLAVEEPSDESGLPYILIDEDVVEAAKECQSAKKEVMYVINKIDLLARGRDMPKDHQILSQIYRAFPNTPSNRVFAISCKDADPGDASATTLDPGSIQRFLNGLTSVFSEITTASADTDDVSSAPISPAQAQSYWSASLSITHRQSTYLQQCLFQLDEFLVRAGSQPYPIRQQCTTSDDFSHHVDNHDNLVSDTQGGIEGDIDIVALAEHLRFAADCLAKITGRGEGGDVEDVLGVVFEK